ncbi:MAG TPA: ABC transporter permease, partial [Thermoplasmata archaeon]|nr:ABC transporter permease [Thermoplasmata archaeon]
RRGKRPNPRMDQYKRTFYFLRRNRLAMFGLIIVLFWIGVALYSPFYNAPSDHLAPYCSSEVVNGTNATCAVTVCTYGPGQPAPPHCFATAFGEPSVVGPTVNFTHFTWGPLPLGSLTVNAGGGIMYNILAGLIKGAPWSLGISAAIVSTGAVVGLLLGSLAGYRGGYLDETIMRFTDIFLAIPGLFLVLVTLSAVGSRFATLDGRVGILIVAFVVTWWPLYTRIVRGQVLVTREQKYVEAARASGAGSGRILRKHIIPNSLYPVFVQLSLDIGTIPLLLGAIIFLGYQLWPSIYFPEWGTISAFAVTSLQSFLLSCSISSSISPCVFPWWQIFFPGLTLFLFCISVNFLSDGLRDALDPRLRR